MISHHLWAALPLICSRHLHSHSLTFPQYLPKELPSFTYLLISFCLAYFISLYTSLRTIFALRHQPTIIICVADESTWYPPVTAPDFPHYIAIAANKYPVTSVTTLFNISIHPLYYMQDIIEKFIATQSLNTTHFMLTANGINSYSHSKRHYAPLFNE